MPSRCLSPEAGLLFWPGSGDAQPPADHVALQEPLLCVLGLSFLVCRVSGWTGSLRCSHPAIFGAWIGGPVGGTPIAEAVGQLTASSTCE